MSLVQFFVHHFDAKQMADDSKDESANCPALKISKLNILYIGIDSF